MTRGREVVLGGLLTIVTAASAFSPRTRLACGCSHRMLAYFGCIRSQSSRGNSRGRRERWAATAKHISNRAEPRRGATYKGEART